MTAQTFPLPSLEATEALGQRLAAALQPGHVVLLEGDLGAGKTTLARSIIQALCANEREVPSPTFTLVQVYEGAKGPVYHFDLYRLTAPEDVYELGWQDALVGITLVEWPVRLGPLKPAEAVVVQLAYGDSEDERLATISGLSL